MKIQFINNPYRKELIIEKINHIHLIKYHKILENIFQNKENHFKKVKKFMLRIHNEKILFLKMQINYLYVLKRCLRML